MMNYRAVGASLTAVPVLGGAVQRAVDVGTAAYMSDLNATVDADTRKNLVDHFENGENRMDVMTREMAMRKGPTKDELDASPSEYEDHLRTTAENWYQYGIEDALKKTGQP